MCVAGSDIFKGHMLLLLRPISQPVLPRSSVSSLKDGTKIFLDIVNYRGLKFVNRVKFIPL